MLDLNIVYFQVHHGEKFVERPCKRYLDRQLKFYHEFDKDYISFFEIEKIVKNFGHVKGDKLFYLLPHRAIQISIRPIMDDKDCMEMLACYKGKKFIDIYMVCLNIGMQLGRKFMCNSKSFYI